MASSYLLLGLMIFLVLPVLVFALDFSGSTSGHIGGRGGFLVFLIAALGILIGFYAAHMPVYQGSAMQQWVASTFGGTGTSAVATTAASTVKKAAGTAPIDPPTGFVFEPSTGILKAPGPIPAGYVLVLKYESVKSPLTGDQALKGKDMGTGQTWRIPTDAEGIEALYWNKTANEATGFVVPF